MTSPRVSIGLPVYNGENYLEASIRSILDQDFDDFELIISDNGSTDSTPLICERHVRADPRIRYYRSDTNRGAAWNYNRLFELSRGEFFKWQAHDDVCHPSFLTRCMEVFESSPRNVVVVYPRTEVIGEDGKKLPQYKTECIDTREDRPHKRVAKVLKNLNMACAIFGLIRTSALKQTRLIGRFIASDYVLLSELAMLGELHEVPELLFFRRVHPRISTYASTNATQLLQWFDPSKAKYRNPIPPMMWLGIEYFRSARSVPVGRIDRVRCCITIARVWYLREFRNLAGRYKSYLLQSLLARRV